MTIILIIAFFILLALAPVHMFLQISDDFSVCTKCFLIQAIILKIQTHEIRIIPSCFVKEVAVSEKKQNHND